MGCRSVSGKTGAIHHVTIFTGDYPSISVKLVENGIP